LKEWTPPDSRNTPSTTYLEEEEEEEEKEQEGVRGRPRKRWQRVDAEQVNRPNP
jgi:predicted ArsR family transcriptional regulator